jgi:hypothetical protein
MAKPKPTSARLVLVAFAAVFAGTIAGPPGCESYETGSTRTKTTKTVETPEERTTTTTKRERTVEDYPD